MFASDKFFNSGPFASASINSQNFSDGLYFAHLFQISLDQQQEIEQERNIAELNNDTDLMLKKKTELDYLDGVFKLTLEIHNTSGEFDS